MVPKIAETTLTVVLTGHCYRMGGGVDKHSVSIIAVPLALWDMWGNVCPCAHRLALVNGNTTQNVMDGCYNFPEATGWMLLLPKGFFFVKQATQARCRDPEG